MQLVGMIIIVTEVAQLFWYLFFCQQMEEKEKKILEIGDERICKQELFVNNRLHVV